MKIKISKAEKDMMDIMEKECIDNKVKEMKLRPDWIIMWNCIRDYVMKQ